MSDVKIVKLVGVTDDLICKIEKSNGKMRMCNILVIRAIPVEVEPKDKKESNLVLPEKVEQAKEYRFSIAMAPFLMPYMKDGPLDCDKCQISYMIDATDEVAERYESVFSSIIKPKFGPVS